MRNNLLRLMLPDDFARLAPYLESREQGKGDLILARGMPVTHLIFMKAGTRSLIAVSQEEHIRAGRGCIVIRDREGVEEFAGDAYGVPEAEYERLIGPLNPGR